ncbi:unnamed protein product [Onchocerca flexuosa]|uniref:Uncharacterized protein n=1 Tax=Onchocerca flexuosa TaxID=387005 RepID=A0A183H5G5_9BILA|nr:unnamed protein product [Onchocerca flexuosa]
MALERFGGNCSGWSGLMSRICSSCRGGGAWWRYVFGVARGGQDQNQFGGGWSVVSLYRDNGYPKMTVHSNESEFSTEEFEYPSDRVEDDILELLHSVTVEQ